MPEIPLGFSFDPTHDGFVLRNKTDDGIVTEIKVPAEQVQGLKAEIDLWSDRRLSALRVASGAVGPIVVHWVLPFGRSETSLSGGSSAIAQGPGLLHAGSGLLACGGALLRSMAWSRRAAKLAPSGAGGDSGELGFLKRERNRRSAHPPRVCLPTAFVDVLKVVEAGRELFASLPKTQQHIPVLDFMIGLTDGFQFEFSQGLECLDAPSGNDGGPGSISVR
jgi:hypothetical protein